MTTPDKKFEYSFIRSPKDIAGKMTPFRQTWWVQYLGDGTSAWPDTRRGVFEFVAEFYEICDTIQPQWLTKELAKPAKKKRNHCA